MARGNGRQDITLDDHDRRRLQDGLELATGRFEWQVYSFVLMTNHLHVFLQTPLANLSRGMQQWLSSYANWWSRRHQRPGHVFQGRFRSDLVENDSYFWTVSRYIHLNPVRAKLVKHPADWPWSSYPGYAHRGRALPWVSYEELWRAWQGEWGGTDSRRAYRRFVEQGLADPPPSPFAEAYQGWILGSQEFVDRLRARVRPDDLDREVPQARPLRSLSISAVLRVVAEHFGIAEEAMRQRSRNAEVRAVAAWLAKRYTSATLRQLAEHLGLGRAQSVGNLTRRIELTLPSSRKLRRNIKTIEAKLARIKEEGTAKPSRQRKKKKK